MEKTVQQRKLTLTVAHAGVPGRLRLRCERLRRDRHAAAHVRAALDRLPGLERVEVRTGSGSIVLAFAASTPWQTVAQWVQDALTGPAAAPARPHPPGKMPRRTIANAKAPAQARARPGEDWHAQDAAQILRSLDSHPEHGLAQAWAQARLLQDGANVSPAEKPRSRLSILLKQFNSLPVGLLAGSSVVSMATGGVSDAISTLTVIAANAVLGYVTEGQAEFAIRQLMDGAGHDLRVIRDGQERRVPASELVRGDIYLVRAGEQVAADARLLAVQKLRVDESALTGETLPVGKSASAAVPFEAPIGARPNMLHAGTIIAEGAGRAVVVATGRNTEAARIAYLSQTAERPQAPVEVELDELGRVLVRWSLAAVGVFFVIGRMRGYPLAQIFQDSLALTVAAVPEGLPVVSTSTMALGLRRMEKKNILVRHVQAIETLGALQTVCLDKTGTLTMNKMSVVAAAAGVSDAGSDDPGALQRLLQVAALNNDADVGDGGAVGSSATERALLDFALVHGVDVGALRHRRPRLRTIERGADRPWMATVHAGRGARTMIKGAPDGVLAMCTSVRDGARTRPLTEADREAIRGMNTRMAARPARVLGFAQRGAAPEGDDDPGGLTWLGLVGLADPLRPGAKPFVQALQRAGITPVIISGDQAATASALARELGLSKDGRVRVIDSTELSGIAPELLADLALRTDVFARVSAHEKLAIVQALQASGRVVGMTGDGANDGPALKAADVGIAMGASGTDLARDVANVVIRNDELETLVDAIAEGRTIYRNIRRALSFLITTNMSEILTEIAEALHGAGELETPMELLWINIVTDVLPGLGLAVAAPDEDGMLRPPRDPSEPIVMPGDFRRMVIDGSTIAGSAMVSHLAGLLRYGPGPETRGMTFLSLSMGQLIYTLFSQRRDVRKLNPRRLLENRVLDAAVLGSMGLAVMPFFVPPLRRLLGVAPLRPVDTAIALAAAAAPGVLVLARRGIEIELQQSEVTPCETL